MSGFQQRITRFNSPLLLRVISRLSTPRNIRDHESGIAMLEAVIFIGLAVAVVLPLLIFVLVPRFMATSLNEKITLGYESTAVSTNDLSELSMEGLTIPRDSAGKAKAAQSAVNQLEKLTNLPAGTFCGAILTVEVDQAGNVGAAQLDSSYNNFGPGCAALITDVPTDAVNAFISSVDLRQAGVQTGFTVFSGNMFSRMRATTVKANKGAAP